MAIKKKKKKFIQTEFKTFFDVKWKYISGERCTYNCPDSGVTRMEAVTAEQAEQEWKQRNNFAGRKFKVVSVTEAPLQQNKKPNAKQTREYEYDDIPDF